MWTTILLVVLGGFVLWMFARHLSGAGGGGGCCGGGGHSHGGHTPTTPGGHAGGGGCGSHGGGTTPTGSSSVSDAAIYTCPMHPEVRQTTVGRCPKCGMNLEPAGK